MKKIKKGLLGFLILIISLFPLNILAYSKYVIPGGENLGIEIHSDGIIVIGFYKINGNINKGNPNLKVGDRIIRVNNIPVTSIAELIETIDNEVKNNQVTLTYIRNNKEKTSVLELYLKDGIYKTGLYVKDGLTGIGTLTYIDPNTLIFGALGHEVSESTSHERIEVKTGTIFKSTITSIDKSASGNPGGKNAKFYYNVKYGNIIKNTNYGIFGIYEKDLPDKETLSVAEADEILKGDALIYTVLNGEDIETFKINILKVEEKNNIKNITFEVTDEDLLDKTGGIVQGMSGSPIVQNDKIIGAVTHVFVDDTKMGYGLLITTMLKEGEK